MSSNTNSESLLALSDADKSQLKERGISVEEIHRQFKILSSPPPKMIISKPCTICDGIHAYSQEEQKALDKLAQEAIQSGLVSDFIPASGAATRMFADLIAASKNKKILNNEAAIRSLKKAGTKEEQSMASAVIAFAENLSRFGFFEDLRATVLERSAGKTDIAQLNVSELFTQDRIHLIIESLLGPQGLGYAQKPKALLLFHRYDDAARTSLEEHLISAAMAGKDTEKRCRVHFTVSEEHRAGFDALINKTLPGIEKKLDCVFEITFSTQEPSTDTIALDSAGHLYRNQHGNLVFRAGGHGSLLNNLAKINSQIVYLNNIDNAQTDKLKADAVFSRRVLIGGVLATQKVVFEKLRLLDKGSLKESDLDATAKDLFPKLNISIPSEKWNGLDFAKKAELTRQLLNRPIRACGMVKNEGEPGGGPFWVTNEDGILSAQIVEQAEVDSSNEQQASLLKKGTHFNPVRIVCGLRDYQGKAFELNKFVNQKAVFTSIKDIGGTKIRILERPGLWNGSMSDWITLFIEVDLCTFTPVKTVLDLIRPAHQ